MGEEVITHGISYIWNMEIEDYKDVNLSDSYNDTTKRSSTKEVSLCVT